MNKKTNKDINNVEKYTYLSNMNLAKAESAVEHLNENLEVSVSQSELFDVIDMSYEKDNKDVQIQEVIEYLEIENNKKALFWAKKAVKFYGLHNWAEFQKNKFVNVGE